MAYDVNAPTNSRYLQGSQIVRMDSRIEVRDRLNNIQNRFPIADYGSIADNGEFHFRVDLDTGVQPTYLIDQDLTGYTGDSPAEDIDLMVITTTDPICLVLGYGVNSYTPTVLPVYDFLIWKGNAPYDIELETGFYRRVLPFQIYVRPTYTTASVEIYLAKFSSV